MKATTRRPWAIPVEVDGGGRFLTPAREFVPSYLETWESGRLREKVEEALEALRACTLCPRHCEIDRLSGRFAVCKSARHARVSSRFPHFGEEDVLRGWQGSGTIFFAWCNLRCVFCVHPETRVLTDRGMLRIEDIFALGHGGMAVADGEVRGFERLRVWTREGRLAPVSKVFAHPHCGDLVVVKPYGLPPLKATPEHAIFAALTPGGEVRKVPAGELTRSHFLVVPKPHASLPVVLNIRESLLPYVGTFRLSSRRRTSVTRLRAVMGLDAPRRTSEEIGRQLGYHPAYVRSLRGRLVRGLLTDDEFISNALIEEGGRIRFKTEKGPGIPRSLALTGDLARVLGYYCAEGHVASARNRPNSHRLIFSYGLGEPSLASRTVDLIREIFGIEATLVPRRTTVTVEVGSASLALFFQSLCGTGSKAKRVPEHLLDAPAEILRAFLEGYFEGDGCRQPRYVAANTVSEEMALGLVALLLRVGVFPYFYATRRKPSQIIEGRTVRQAVTLYYVKCRREAWDGTAAPSGVRYRETQDAFFVPIREISREPYDGPVYNLEVVDADHSYIASGVAVGNCQNYETSQQGQGVEVAPQDLARMMLELQARGCHNINFVTPEHVVPQILEALPSAIERGLRLPIIYNTSAYDSLHSIRLMEGVVDIYMPDFKLWNPERARRYLLAPDYPEAARRVIRAMHEQVGELRVNEDGLAVRGLLVRHLVMPGLLEDTREIVRWVADLSPDSYVNVMDQYQSAWKAKTDEKYRDVNRAVESAEMEAANTHARDAGLWRFDRRWRSSTDRLWARLAF
jgi:putative pyruvate formate lyase activating enzyme